MREDFPVSGENVRKADKRGVGPSGLAPKATEGEKMFRILLFFRNYLNILRFILSPSQLR